MLGSETLPISSIHSAGLLETDDIRFALLQLKSVIIFKTFEITRFMEDPTSTIAFVDHCHHLFGLYHKYNALSSDAPLDELIDNLPSLAELEEQLQENGFVDVDEDVTNPNAIPGRYTPGPRLPNIDRKLLIHNVENRQSTERTLTERKPFFTKIPEMLGLRSECDSIATVVADIVVDNILEDIMSSGSELIMKDHIHHAYVEAENEEIEKLINEAVAIAAKNRAISVMVLQSIREEEASKKQITSAPTSFLNWMSRPNGFEERILNFSSTKGSLFENNSSSKWDFRSILRFSEFLREGVQVYVHRLGEVSEPSSASSSSSSSSRSQRVMRARRVLFLDEQCSRILLFPIHGSGTQEVLTEEPEFIMALSDIQLVCMGACSILLQESLSQMNGSMYRSDSIEQSRRCFSLIGLENSVHVEVKIRVLFDLF